MGSRSKIVIYIVKSQLYYLFWLDDDIVGEFKFIFYTCTDPGNGHRDLLRIKVIFKINDEHQNNILWRLIRSQSIYLRKSWRNYLKKLVSNAEMSLNLHIFHSQLH